MPSTASRRDHHEGQLAAGSYIEQLDGEVQPSTAPRAVHPSLVPGQGKRGHGQPGEPDQPSKLGRAPGSYLLEILPPCQDLGDEVWSFPPEPFPPTKC